MIQITQNVAVAMNAAFNIMDEDFPKELLPRTWIREIGKPKKVGEVIYIQFTFWIHSYPDRPKFIKIELVDIGLDIWRPSKAEVTYNVVGLIETWEFNTPSKPINKKLTTKK